MTVEDPGYGGRKIIRSVTDQRKGGRTARQLTPAGPLHCDHRHRTVHFFKHKAGQMNGVTTRQLSGLVTELDISGWGPNSSQLEFAIQPKAGPTETLVMEFDAVPQMFAAATTILMTAYQNKIAVEVTIPLGQPRKDTPKISGVKVPA